MVMICQVPLLMLPCIFNWDGGGEGFQVVNVHIPQDLSYLRRLICERQKVLNNLGRGLTEKAVRGEEQFHYTGESADVLFCNDGCI